MVDSGQLGHVRPPASLFRSTESALVEFLAAGQSVLFAVKELPIGGCVHFTHLLMLLQGGVPEG